MNANERFLLQDMLVSNCRKLLLFDIRFFLFICTPLILLVIYNLTAMARCA